MAAGAGAADPDDAGKCAEAREPARTATFQPHTWMMTWLWWSKPMGYHFGVGEFATLFMLYFIGIGMFTGGMGF